MDRLIAQINKLPVALGPYRDDLVILCQIIESDRLMGFAKGRQIAEKILIEILKDSKKLDRFEKNIDTCQAKGLLPSEIATLMHYIRIMGNKQHAGALKIEITDRDIENLLNNLLRIYEWFFCDYENGLQMDGINKASSAFEIDAFRFIPFFVGTIDALQHAVDGDFMMMETDSGKLYYYDDGFSVLVIEDKIKCNGVVDFLCQRREKHQSILNSNSIVLQSLQEISGTNNNPLILFRPECFEYVMSIHFIDKKNYDITLSDISCIVEPSLLGISDEPSETIEEKDIIKAEQLFLNIDGNLPEGVVSVDCEDHTCYISWANVLFCMSNEDDYLQQKIIEHEVKLQKLWYKLFIYNNMIERIASEVISIDFAKVKKEIFKTKIEYSNLTKVQATGSSFSNSVNMALNNTSHIGALYTSFNQNVTLLKEMEDIL